MRRLEQDNYCEPPERDPFQSSALVIHGRPGASARALVIFVHGLGGHAYGPKSTWGFFPKFVFEDFRDAEVAQYSYTTLSGRLKFWHSITLDEEAMVFAHSLRDMSQYDSVVIIAHSMGGLLAEAGLAYLIETRQTSPVAKLRGLILMATPQAGSLRVPRVLNWLKDFAALRPHGRLVERIQQTLGNYVSLTDEPSEGKPFHVPTWAILGAHDFWVDRLSSRFNLPDARIKLVRGSHTSLVKPASKSDDAYCFVRDCIGHSLAPAARRPRETTAGAPPAPAPVTLLVSRTGALNKLLEFLQPSQPAGSLITAALVSAPGQGQTTVASALAQHPDICRRLPDGTLWLTLGEHPDVLMNLAAWGRQLGADLSCYDAVQVRSLALSLLLTSRRMLLVLDDVRRVEDAKPFLAGGAGCRALITTCDPAVARALAGDRSVAVDKLPAAESVQLLRQLAPRALAGNDEQAHKLAEALEGSPMELNLVGRLLEQAHPARPLISEIDELRRIETDTGDPAGATRRAVLRVTYSSLPDPDAQRLFRSLAVFGTRPVSFSLEAAAAICDATDGLEILLQRGMVNRTAEARFFLQPALSQFATSLLEETAELAGLERAHAQFYLQFAEAHAPHDWTRIEDDLEQIQRGFHFAGRLQNHAMVLAYARAMLGFLFHRGLLDQARRWTQAALLSATQLADRHSEAFLLRMSGRIHWQRGQKDAALECFERCLALCESDHDDAELVRVLMNLGVVSQSRHDWASAALYYERARALAEHNGEWAKLGQALRGLGFVRHKLGDWAGALAYYEESAQVSRAADLAQALANIAELHSERREFNRALEFHQRALAVREQAGDSAATAQSHIALGELCSKLGDLDGAQRHYEKSLAICQDIADIQGLSISLNRVADVLARRKPAEAETLRRKSQALTEAYSAPYEHV